MQRILVLFAALLVLPAAHALPHQKSASEGLTAAEITVTLTIDYSEYPVDGLQADAYGCAVSVPAGSSVADALDGAQANGCTQWTWAIYPLGLTNDPAGLAANPESAIADRFVAAFDGRLANCDGWALIGTVPGVCSFYSFTIDDEFATAGVDNVLAEAGTTYGFTFTAF